MAGTGWAAFRAGSGGGAALDKLPSGDVLVHRAVARTAQGFVLCGERRVWSTLDDIVKHAEKARQLKGANSVLSLPHSERTK